MRWYVLIELDVAEYLIGQHLHANVSAALLLCELLGLLRKNRQDSLTMALFTLFRVL